MRIVKIDEDPVLKDFVYRIQMLCKLIFDSSTIYKIFATEDYKIFRSATPAQSVFRTPPGTTSPKGNPDVAGFELKCPGCNKKHKIYLKFSENKKIDDEFKAKGYLPYPANNEFKCDCGFIIDLTGIKNQLEIQAGKRATPTEGYNAG